MRLTLRDAGLPALMEAYCPCGRASKDGRALTLAQCCGRYLQDFAGTPAPDAESLMRSRYTAFVLGDEDYLLASWHASTRPSQAQGDAAARWLGLEVRGATQSDAGHATVEFVARYRHQGRGVRLHERSRFVRDGVRWFYVDGQG
ncbi:MAG: YchJ family metal-binding protein [Burkholderiaceae bacterium]|nr:YchJ family metal-binding protein [Burkholderiaceae bacterium]